MVEFLFRFCRQMKLAQIEGVYTYVQTKKLDMFSPCVYEFNIGLDEYSAILSGIVLRRANH